jgi:hypothetical protein
MLQLYPGSGRLSFSGEYVAIVFWFKFSLRLPISPDCFGADQVDFSVIGNPLTIRYNQHIANIMIDALNWLFASLILSSMRVKRQVQIMINNQSFQISPSSRLVKLGSFSFGVQSQSILFLGSCMPLF